MKKIVAFILTIMISLSLLAQSQVVNEKIEIIDKFHSINLNSKYSVYVKQSNETKIEVRALKEYLDISEFEIEDGVLNINIKREEKDRNIWEQIDDIKISPKLDVYISMQEIKALNVNGNGKIIAENSIASEDLILSVSGSGVLEVDVKGNYLDIDLSGSGNMKLKGYATEAALNLSGYGQIEAFKLDLKKMNATLSGAGNVRINIKEELDAKVYGSGKLSFKGDTKQVTKKIYGSGKIERTY